MTRFLPLQDLGLRICICGPSNSGKSTLAAALARKLDIEAIHLDQLYHQPNTDWVPRPWEEFERLHAEAIARPVWAMEGSYFAAITPRLKRATGIILLGNEPWKGLVRYVRRTLFQRQRAGHIEGGKDRLKLWFAHYIVIEQPRKRKRDEALLQHAGLPMIHLRSMAELKQLYAQWGLER